MPLLNYIMLLKLLPLRNMGFDVFIIVHLNFYTYLSNQCKFDACCNYTWERLSTALTSSIWCCGSNCSTWNKTSPWSSLLVDSIISHASSPEFLTLTSCNSYSDLAYSCRSEKFSSFLTAAWFRSSNLSCSMLYFSVNSDNCFRNISTICFISLSLINPFFQLTF